MIEKTQRIEYGVRKKKYGEDENQRTITSISSRCPKPQQTAAEKPPMRPHKRPGEARPLRSLTPSTVRHSHCRRRLVTCANRFENKGKNRKRKQRRCVGLEREREGGGEEGGDPSGGRHLPSIRNLSSALERQEGELAITFLSYLYP